MWKRELVQFTNFRTPKNIVWLELCTPSIEHFPQWKGRWESKTYYLTCRMSLLIPTAILSCWPDCWDWLFSTGSDNSRSCWITSVTDCWPWCPATEVTGLSVYGERKRALNIQMWTRIQSKTQILFVFQQLLFFKIWNLSALFSHLCNDTKEAKTVPNSSKQNHLPNIIIVFPLFIWASQPFMAILRPSLVYLAVLEIYLAGTAGSTFLGLLTINGILCPRGVI